MAEINSTAGKIKNKGFGRSRKNIPRVDLTPMVDLGFILLSFFVFTSTMSQPKAMDYIGTANGQPTPVRESGSMTFLLGNNHLIGYYEGRLTSGAQVQLADFAKLLDIIIQKKNNTKPDHLMYIIKAGKEATMKDLVDLLDEMIICGIPNGHYAEVDITQEEADIIDRF